MPAFENVTVKKEANIYFDGKVTSRTLTFADGTIKTLGIMQPGEYTFSTESAELMEILRGELTVRIGSAEHWRQVEAGGSFEVPANATFAVRVATLTDYCCSFLR